VSQKDQSASLEVGHLVKISTFLEVVSVRFLPFPNPYNLREIVAKFLLLLSISHRKLTTVLLKQLF
jgi:hypothetical protein